MVKSIFQHIPLSQLLLVIAFNLLPVAGILFSDWRALDLLYLYAAENFVILIFSLLKFRLAIFDYLYAYFYAAFCAMQMFFLLNLLGDMQMIPGYDRSLSLLDLNLLVIDQENLYLGLAIMLICYILDLIRSTVWFKNLIQPLKKTNKINRAGLAQQNKSPADSIFLSGDIKMFERLAVMQLTLIIGGALVVVFKSAFFALVVLLLLKLGLEIALRVRVAVQQNRNSVQQNRNPVKQNRNEVAT